MKKIIFYLSCFLFLTGCKNDLKHDNTSTVSEKNSITFYAIDGFTGEYDLSELLLSTSLYTNGKTYTFDNSRSLTIGYENLPIFKTEVMRQILTPHKYFSNKSQHLTNYQYVLGDEASFDGQVLKYKIKSENAHLNLTWKFEKIDVSGRAINSDLNNPIHKINLGINSKIMADILGIGFSDLDVFPKGSICWQKKSADATEDYIEFYPKDSVRHASSDNRVKKLNFGMG